MTIAHITLAVRDARRSSCFYAAVLGWKPLDRPANIALPAAWLEITAGQELHLVQVSEYQSSPFDREYGRHVAVYHPGADFAALKDRLRREGVEVIAPLRETPFERFFFRDPDGYFFEVIVAGAIREAKPHP